jgi:hypothetical protein
MEFDPQDQKIVELLTKLKGANGEYPSEMLESRRQTYLNQMAGLGLGAGLETMLKNAAKNGNGAGFTPPTAGPLLEVALVVAIIVEAGTLAFFYRDRVVDFFKSTSTTPATQEVTSPPVSTFSFPTMEVSISAIPTESLAEIAASPATEEVTSPSISTFSFPTESLAGIVASTATPGAPGDLNTNSPAGGATQVSTNSTPNPNVNNGNNGNHYGQTPKPERTKDHNRNQPP